MTEHARQGGAEWELQQAAELLADAVAAGDAEKARTAMMRHSQALVTQSYATLVPTLERVLTVIVKGEVGKLATSVEASANLETSRFTYLMDRLAFFLATEDSRHDNANEELNKIYEALDELREDVRARRLHINNRLDQVDSVLARIDRIELCLGCPLANTTNER